MSEHQVPVPERMMEIINAELEFRAFVFDEEHELAAFLFRCCGLKWGGGRGFITQPVALPNGTIRLNVAHMTWEGLKYETILINNGMLCRVPFDKKIARMDDAVVRARDEIYFTQRVQQLQQMQQAQQA